MGIPFEPVQVAWPGRPYFQTVPMELPSLDEELPMTASPEEVVRELIAARRREAERSLATLLWEGTPPDPPAIVEAADAER